MVLIQCLTLRLCLGMSASPSLKGPAGKRMWATLASQVAGRSHGAVELIEKSDAPSKILKFTSGRAPVPGGE